MRSRNIISAIIVISTLAACTLMPVAQRKSEATYITHIRWTSYGIPHVKADNWKSLGYGFA